MGVRQEAKRMGNRLVAWRRDFHAHPELGYQEHRTAHIVSAYLERLGYQVHTGIGETGVMGVLAGAHAGPVVMFRFDMDALPLEEQTEAPYASQVPGLMHACGHDGHVALGMGLAELVAACQLQMSGTVKIVFQPAEEVGTGAKAMIRDGVLLAPRPDIFVAAHIWNNRPAGTVDVRAGPIMAAADTWSCVVRGCGGHGALPHLAVDPIVAAAQVVNALQTVVSCSVSPLDTAVVTVSSIHGGEAFNVLPAQVEMCGTLRTFERSVREMVVRRMHEITTSVAGALGASAALEVAALHPAVVNEPKVADVVARAARAVLGPDRVTATVQTTGSEDASDFLQEVPGCFFFVGATDPEKELTGPHHNPLFDFDERALVVGLAVLAQTAAYYLSWP